MQASSSLRPFAFAGLVGGLIALGFVTRAGALGYEHGKADATRAVAPYGVVLLYADGRCEVYDQPGQQITVNVGHGLAHLTTVVRVR